jgi:hypothetical protein
VTRSLRLPFLLLGFLAFMNCSTATASQDSTFTKSQEFGLSFIHFGHLSMKDRMAFRDWKIQPEAGIQYKKQITPFKSMRVLVSYGKMNLELKQFHPSYNAVFKEERSVNISIGVEQPIAVTRPNIYSITDISQSTGTYAETGVYNPDIYSRELQTVDMYDYYRFGIAQGLGYKLEVSQNLWFNIETSIYGYSETKFGTGRNGKPTFGFYYTPISRLSLGWRL